MTIILLPALISLSLGVLTLRARKRSEEKALLSGLLIAGHLLASLLLGFALLLMNPHGSPGATLSECLFLLTHGHFETSIGASSSASLDQFLAAAIALASPELMVLSAYCVLLLVADRAGRRRNRS